MNCLKLSIKFGIAALVILAVLVRLSVLCNSEGDDGTEMDEETCEKPFWGRWKRGFGFGLGDAETVEKAVEEMTEKLGLTEEEVEDVMPIAQEIADLREQLRAKREELHGIIGPKVEDNDPHAYHDGFQPIYLLLPAGRHCLQNVG